MERTLAARLALRAPREPAASRSTSSASLELPGTGVGTGATFLPLLAARQYVRWRMFTYATTDAVPLARGT